jgi:hypothetical protein
VSVKVGYRLRLLGGFDVIGYYNPVLINSPFKGLFVLLRCLYK